MKKPLTHYKKGYIITNLRYAKNIVTETREYTKEEMAMLEEMMKKNPIKSTIEMERLLWMDDTKVEGATFYMECIWLWGGKTTSGTTEEPHQHAHDEVIGFISSDADNPKELDAKMEILLGDETHWLTKSCLVHIPAGMKHCPLTFREVNRPVFFFTLMPISRYGRKTENLEGRKEPEIKIPEFKAPPKDAIGSCYARYIITEPKRHGPPPDKSKPKPPPKAKTTQIVSLDSDVSPGAFYVDFVWIWSGDMKMAAPHAHDWDEMIGFIGLPESKANPRGINGKVTIKLGDETHNIKQSSLVFVPKNVSHCPIQMKGIKTPMLLFTIGNIPLWTEQGKK